MPPNRAAAKAVMTTGAPRTASMEACQSVSEAESEEDELKAAD